MNSGINYKSTNNNYKPINNNYKFFDNKSTYGQKNEGTKKVLPFDRIDFDHL